MNEQKKEILENNAKEYFYSGDENLKNGRYNSAVVLFFKSLIAFSDLYVLENLGFVPSSHLNRFRVLEDKFPEVYSLVDKDFPFYQDSYNKLMSKELAEVIKDDAKVMAEKVKIKL